MFYERRLSKVRIIVGVFFVVIMMLSFTCQESEATAWSQGFSHSMSWPGAKIFSDLYVDSNGVIHTLYPDSTDIWYKNYSFNVTTYAFVQNTFTSVSRSSDNVTASIAADAGGTVKTTLMYYNFPAVGDGQITVCDYSGASCTPPISNYVIPSSKMYSVNMDTAKTKITASGSNSPVHIAYVDLDTSNNLIRVMYAGPTAGATVLESVSNAGSDFVGPVSIDSFVDRNSVEHILVAYFRGGVASTSIYLRESTDGGATWTTATVVRTGVGSNTGQINSMYISIAVDKVGNWNIIHSNYSGGNYQLDYTNLTRFEATSGSPNAQAVIPSSANIISAGSISTDKLGRLYMLYSLPGSSLVYGYSQTGMDLFSTIIGNGAIYEQLSSTELFNNAGSGTLKSFSPSLTYGSYQYKLELKPGAGNKVNIVTIDGRPLGKPVNMIYIYNVYGPHKIDVTFGP